MSGAGTEHSHWALWGTWRRGPDLVTHVAEVVAEQIERPATVEVLVRNDVEVALSTDDIGTAITENALKRFSVLLIHGTNESKSLRVRIAFVRRPADILVGDCVPRSARVKYGVVLEVTSSDRDDETNVAEAKRAIARAIERGRPRWVTRVARHGRAARADPRPGFPREIGGSASRLLEERLRHWPTRSGFPVIFTALSLALYAGLVVALAKLQLYNDQRLQIDEASVRAAVAVMGVAVAAAAFLAQRWLFPPVEVATLPNASRVIRTLLSSVTLSAAIPIVLKVSGVNAFFG